MGEKYPYRKRGLAGALATYFLENVNRRVTVEELMEAEPKWTRQAILGSITTGMQRARENKPTNPVFYKLEKVHTGCWIYRGNITAPTKKETPKPEPVKPGMMLVEILKERPDRLIVEDTDDGKLYTMTLIG